MSAPASVRPASWRPLPVFALGDQARAAAARGINPEPAEGDGQTVAHADQEVNVGESPNPPGEPAAHLDRTEIDDGGAFADGGEIAGMLVAEHSLRGVASEARSDCLGNVQALLLRCGSDPGLGLAPPGVDGRRIADH